VEGSSSKGGMENRDRKEGGERRRDATIKGEREVPLFLELDEVV